jgi:hypothetical protein
LRFPYGIFVSISYFPLFPSHYSCFFHHYNTKRILGIVNLFVIQFSFSCNLLSKAWNYRRHDNMGKSLFVLQFVFLGNTTKLANAKVKSRS